MAINDTRLGVNAMNMNDDTNDTASVYIGSTLEIDAHLGKRQKKLVQELKKIAGDFFQKETNGKALITVTNADYSPDLKNATVYITVLPDQYEKEAVGFAMRMRGELKLELKRRMAIRILPHVEVKLDLGEKHRQKIEGLLKVNTTI